MGNGRAFNIDSTKIFSFIKEEFILAESEYELNKAINEQDKTSYNLELAYNLGKMKILKDLSRFIIENYDPETD
jgi:hypothetical protein